MTTYEANRLPDPHEILNATSFKGDLAFGSAVTLAVMILSAACYFVAQNDFAAVAASTGGSAACLIAGTVLKNYFNGLEVDKRLEQARAAETAQILKDTNQQLSDLQNEPNNEKLSIPYQIKQRQLWVKQMEAKLPGGTARSEAWKNEIINLQK